MYDRETLMCCREKQWHFVPVQESDIIESKGSILRSVLTVAGCGRDIKSLIFHKVAEKRLVFHIKFINRTALMIRSSMSVAYDIICCQLYFITLRCKDVYTMC